MSTILSKRDINHQRWLERITDWKQSGQSQKTFCEQHYLVLASFRRWHQIFMKEEKRQESKPVIFLPVSVKDIPTSNLTILIDGNLRIEIPAGFDPHLLKQVLQVCQTS